MAEEKMGSIEIELSDEEFLELAKMAHEKDITFNALVTEILEDFIRREEEKNGK